MQPTSERRRSASWRATRLAAVLAVAVGAVILAIGAIGPVALDDGRLTELLDGCHPR